MYNVYCHWQVTALQAGGTGADLFPEALPQADWLKPFGLRAWRRNQRALKTLLPHSLAGSVPSVFQKVLNLGSPRAESLKEISPEHRSGNRR